MQAIIFYTIYPFLYVIASLPFKYLYVISDGLYPILKLSGYRRKVIIENFRNSFPQKKEAEIQQLTNDYYRYLCDLTLETIKTLRMTEKETLEHCVFVKKDFLEDFYAQNKTFIIVMGHFGNWEMGGPSFSLNNKFQLNVVYKPLSNSYFENMMYKMRTKFGTKITAMNNILREMINHKNDGRIAYAFIADQSAAQESQYWTNFLNQDTAVYVGPEKLAKRFNYPVVYVSVNKLKRGYYEVVPELLFENPKETAEGEISEVFIRRLEKDILNNPITWLWSHKRWKHKRNFL